MGYGGENVVIFPILKTSHSMNLSANEVKIDKRRYFFIQCIVNLSEFITRLFIVIIWMVFKGGCINSLRIGLSRDISLTTQFL